MLELACRRATDELAHTSAPDAAGKKRLISICDVRVM
jgi:hypothetical protein